MTKKNKTHQQVANNTKQPLKQSELITALVITLLLGLGGGYLIGNNLANSTSTNSDVSMTESMDDSSHSQDQVAYEVESADAPIVRLVVTEDAKSGYNVKLVTDKFTFTPDNVNQANVMGEGHAHLYVDGVKIGRLYGPDYHYNENFEGSKTFKVTLNANDHSEYTVNGEVIESEVLVTHDSNDASHDDKHKDSDSNSSM